MLSAAVLPTVAVILKLHVASKPFHHYCDEHWVDEHGINTGDKVCSKLLLGGGGFL
jgi:hypothetical protein